MEYILWYLVLCIPCFFVAYCNGTDLKGRLPYNQDNLSFWKFHKKFFRDGFRLLVHDYFEVHCPWSWETAKKHRIRDMRIYCEYGRDHKKLGHLTAADCDDQEKQEIIARNTYVSRARFWVNGFFHFLIPIHGIIVIIATFIVGVYELFSYFTDKKA